MFFFSFHMKNSTDEFPTIIRHTEQFNQNPNAIDVFNKGPSSEHEIFRKIQKSAPSSRSRKISPQLIKSERNLSLPRF